MNRKAVAIVLVLAFLLAGCRGNSIGAENPSASAEHSSTSSQTQTPERSAPAAEEETVVLGMEDLQKYTALFDSPEFNGFLSESFHGPEDIEWEEVFRNGAGITVENVSGQEIEDYLKATDQKSLYAELYVLRRGDIAEFIRKHTGADLLPGEDDLPSWEYLPEHDSFYGLHWGDERMLYVAVSGERSGDRITLRFRVSDESPGIDPRSHVGPFADRLLTLTDTGNSIVVESNTILWNEGCDESQSFDVTMPQFDEPVRFITYQQDPDGATLILTKNGKFLTELSTWLTGGYNGYLKKIAAVGFFDFDADGMTDITVIGDSEQGTHALLYQAVAGEGAFEWLADLDGDKAAGIGADLTIGGIRTALTDGHAPGSWREAYAQVAKLYHAAEGDYRYDLIYTDSDEIPELAVDLPGYAMTLFTYENGHTRCLMNRWGYGAMGNHGYFWAPGSGIFYNSNADYAGAIVYETYMSKRNAGELGTDYWVKNLYFNDLDGDGTPSQEELESSGEYIGSAEYHSNVDPGTGEEIRTVVEGMEKLAWQPLVGTMDISELLAKLEK